MKDPNNKNSFIVDVVAGEVVKRIFSLYIGGEGISGIAKRFNDEGLPCPAKHKLKTTTYKNAMIKRYLWTHETVKRILTNPSYIGNMTQRRQTKINYKVEKYRKLPPSEWLVAENTHEPLINKADFDFVQELIAKKAVKYSQPQRLEHLLNGLLLCQDCGVKMTYRRDSSKAKKMMIMCATYSKFGPAYCSRRAVKETEVEKYVLDHLRQIAKNVLSKDFYNRFDDLKINHNEYNEKEHIVKRLLEIKNTIKELYTDKLKGIIDENLFIEMSGLFNSEKECLTKRLTEIESVVEKSITCDYKFIIQKIVEFEVLDRTILVKLIDKIEISKDKEIFIYYNFSNPLEPV